jgi:catechol 2,3-dioxygenase
MDRRPARYIHGQGAGSPRQQGVDQMIDARVKVDVRSTPLLPMTTRLGPVRLAVTSRDQALAVWRDVVGLDLLSETGNLLVLGAGGAPLIELETGATRPSVQRTIGLYHVAIHVPARTDLAQFALRALARNVRIAPTDHLVSEAIYLWDLDGNGIEITFETPWRGTLADPEHGHYAVTVEGKPHSGRDPIDMDDLLGELGPQPTLAPAMPAGTRIGHVHLHVGDLDRAMAFYRDVVGFAGFLLIRSFGMGDVGLDYMPHTIAFNIWSGPNAALPPAGAAGLRWFTILVPDAQSLAETRARLQAAGAPIIGGEDGFETADPFGNRLRFRIG